MVWGFQIKDIGTGKRTWLTKQCVRLLGAGHHKWTLFVHIFRSHLSAVQCFENLAWKITSLVFAYLCASSSDMLRSKE